MMRDTRRRAQPLWTRGRFVALRSRYWGLSGGRGARAWCFLVGPLALYWMHQNPPKG